MTLPHQLGGVSTIAKYLPNTELEQSRVNIHVHHINYDNVGNEAFGDLIVICRECHKYLHDRIHAMVAGRKRKRTRRFVMQLMLPVMRRRLVAIHEAWTGE